MIVPPISDEERQHRYEALKALRDRLIADTHAPLFAYRHEHGFHPVIGEGNHVARILFVGEAPGANEAKQGRPFCGASGKFLDVLLGHIGMKREEAYITNLVKDRPPENRDPLPEEIKYYTPLLDQQIQIIKPLCIATLGRYSMSYILHKIGVTVQPISAIHGKVFSGIYDTLPISVVTLYHPAVALYNGGMRATLLKDGEVLRTFLQ